MRAPVRDTTGGAAAGPGELPPAPRASGGLLEVARSRLPLREAGHRWAMTSASADEVLAVLEREPLRANAAHSSAQDSERTLV